MALEERKPSSFQAESSFQTETTAFAFEPLLSREKHWFQNSNRAFQNFYQKPKSTPSPSKKATSPSQPARKKQISALTQEEKKALETLIRLGANELKDSSEVNESQMKRAFRRLAKAFHPDHQKHLKSDLFRELRANYAILSRAFEKLEKNDDQKAA